MANYPSDSPSVSGVRLQKNSNVPIPRLVFRAWCCGSLIHILHLSASSSPTTPLPIQLLADVPGKAADEDAAPVIHAGAEMELQAHGFSLVQSQLLQPFGES